MEVPVGRLELLNHSNIDLGLRPIEEEGGIDDGFECGLWAELGVALYYSQLLVLTVLLFTVTLFTWIYTPTSQKELRIVYERLDSTASSKVKRLNIQTPRFR